MKVCIEETPEGFYSVYQESESSEGAESGMAAMGGGMPPGANSAGGQPGGMPPGMMGGGESQQQEASEKQGEEQARDIPGALKIAGRMLSQSQGMSSQGGQAFDEGLKSVLPQRGM